MHDFLFSFECDWRGAATSCTGLLASKVLYQM